MAIKNISSLKYLLNFKNNLTAQNLTPATFLCIRPLSSKAQNNKEWVPDNFDIVIVGGGIVGLASAREITQRYPKLKLALLEKENSLAQHQTGHNSGVIHAGIYYTPGSLKAQLCVEGLKLMYQYCDEKKIPYKKVGKLIVATTPEECQRLDVLYERGKANQVPGMTLLTTIDQIHGIEPYCHGLKAIHSPVTGIVDYTQVANSYGKDFEAAGGKIRYNYKVTDFKENNDANYPVQVVSESGCSINARYVLTCCGLQSDIVAELTGCDRSPRIVPFRGEYLLLNESKRHLVKGNIYPVPDPNFPFLGVHFTPRMDGSMWLGPNAVLAFKREGYSWLDFNFKEFFDAIKYPGLQRLALKYIRPGIGEATRSIFKGLQVKQLRKFICAIESKDTRRGPAGVRAQALDMQGGLVDDFVFDMGKTKIGKNVMHCRNAPSPGATSSLAIAKMISDRLTKEFNLDAIASGSSGDQTKNKC